MTTHHLTQADAGTYRPDSTARISRPSTHPHDPYTALGGIQYYALQATHMSDADRLAAIGELIRDYDEAVSGS